MLIGEMHVSLCGQPSPAGKLMNLDHVSLIRGVRPRALQMFLQVAAPLHNSVLFCCLAQI